jgi:hypothetical protein
MSTSLSQPHITLLRESYCTCIDNGLSVLKASGPEIDTYLQGQITQDLGRLTDTQGIYSVVLTPQGKAVSELYLFNGRQEERIMLVPHAVAEASVARLRRFSIGYKLRIGRVDSMQILALQGPETDHALANAALPQPGRQRLSLARASDEELFVLRMPVAADDGVWIVAPEERIAAIARQLGNSMDEETLNDARIVQGSPRFGIDWNEKVHPMNANLAEMDGVSFDKGCYVGQEVTSRMHWRGGIRKRLYHIRMEQLPACLPAAIKTTAAIGQVTSAAASDEGCFGIAMLNIEAAESGQPLQLEDGSTVTLLEACHA